MRKLKTKGDVARWAMRVRIRSTALVLLLFVASLFTGSVFPVAFMGFLLAGSLFSLAVRIYIYRRYDKAMLAEPIDRRFFAQLALPDAFEVSA